MPAAFVLALEHVFRNEDDFSDASVCEADADLDVLVASRARSHVELLDAGDACALRKRLAHALDRVREIPVVREHDRPSDDVHEHPRVAVVLLRVFDLGQRVSAPLDAVAHVGESAVSGDGAFDDVLEQRKILLGEPIDFVETLFLRKRRGDVVSQKSAFVVPFVGNEVDAVHQPRSLIPANDHGADMVGPKTDGGERGSVSVGDRVGSIVV